MKRRLTFSLILPASLFAAFLCFFPAAAHAAPIQPPHNTAVTRCHPTQHGACWFWSCCF